MFARRSRLSMKALRLYDRQGLLVPASVDLDMPLAEVARIVSAPRPRAAELVEAYWQAVERRVAAQRELAAHLGISLAGGAGAYAAYDVRDREVPEQLLVTEQRRLRVDELEGWLEAAHQRLGRAGATLGGEVGPRFAVFHGDVNEDSDGPVELCVPVRLTGGDATTAPVRREPAHREVYVRLTRARFGFPQILSGYDAVAYWINARGLGIGGAPREIYLPGIDPRAGRADEEVCDVAFPLAEAPTD